ncbi:hypothetical protein CBS115989_8136 [Aspergillus niger]|nr:hypothetical protein CBS115989_8136 [Aspergillus niger]KAI2825480.1 hypothetical protein CBS133816_8423 [Aspergillus niger]KAI2834709.1 hypothetical protein CBS11350_10522 [Aspergillus niger]KAI2836041.1 hypothetical protein CBS11232_10298 [Aspergillus niger]KAI2841092.1 hypothetical protein CBS12448_10483 [Aspergillus niger]
MLLALNEWLEVPEKKLQVIVRAVNLLLTASLLIGDIEDGSLLRRRQPVTHKVFGVAQTINSANHTYFLVQQCVQQLGNPQVVEIFTEELLNLHRGQGMDLFWRETLICPTEEEYLDMISNRTASGIGLEIVNELLRQSATVHVLDISSKFPETSQALQHRLHFYPATDVSSRESVSRTIKIIIQKCPDIHGLVNCAGVYRQSASVIDSDENFHKVMSVNLDGVWNTGTEYLRYVLDKGANDPTRSQPEQGPGSVEKCAGSGTSSCSMVNIGSTIVLQGLPGMAAQHYTEASIAENWLSTIPMGRVGSCKEVANAVVFLLGDASSYITGQVLAVSGGFP